MPRLYTQSEGTAARLAENDFIGKLLFDQIKQALYCFLWKSKEFLKCSQECISRTISQMQILKGNSLFFVVLTAESFRVRFLLAFLYLTHIPCPSSLYNIEDTGRGYHV